MCRLGSFTPRPIQAAARTAWGVALTTLHPCSASMALWLILSSLLHLPVHGIWASWKWRLAGLLVLGRSQEADTGIKSSLFGSWMALLLHFV